MSYFKNERMQFHGSNWQESFVWTKFQLSEIIGIENYFYQEINQRKSCTKKLNKYVTAFDYIDYIDKILIVLSATSSGVSIISFTSVDEPHVGTASASLTFIFSLTTGIVKKSVSITRTKKHDNILMVAKSKLNSTETISQALIDMDISHEEFITILKEKR